MLRSGLLPRLDQPHAGVDGALVGRGEDSLLDFPSCPTSPSRSMSKPVRASALLAKKLSVLAHFDFGICLPSAATLAQSPILGRLKLLGDANSCSFAGVFATVSETSSVSS